MMKRLLSLNLILLLLLSSMARAATYYVATTGNDSNPGTQAQPFKTIQKGLDTAANGDTVLVANGTYSGVGNWRLDFGGKNFTLMSQDGAANCTVSGGSNRLFYFHRGETEAAIVDGFTVTGGIENYGGGMRIDGSSPTIRNCVLSNNRAVIPGGGGGIALSDSSARILNCRFVGNRAVDGGGLYISGGSPVVQNCFFSANTARTNSITMLDGRGGGIAIIGGSVKVINTIFSGNQALPLSHEEFGLGGGICLSDGSLTVVQSTFYDNYNTHGGSALHIQSGTATVANSILWADTGGAEIMGAATVTYSDVQGGYTGIGNLNADPLFVNAAGGDFHLQSGSPCREAGTTSAPDLPATDLEGAPRVIGNAPDMGAYEFVPATALFVDKAVGSDSNPGTPQLPFQTVTRALNAATAPDVFYTLYIRANNYGSDRPRITKPVHIRNWGNTGQARIGKP
jgi:hypothetical protein